MVPEGNRPPGEQVGLPLVWVDLDATEISFANMIMIQQGEGAEFFLAFGQVAPPVLVGDEEQNLETLKGIGHLQVRTLARVGTTAERLEQFAILMRQAVTRYHARRRAEEPQGGTRVERRRR